MGSTAHRRRPLLLPPRLPLPLLPLLPPLVLLAHAPTLSASSVGVVAGAVEVEVGGRVDETAPRVGASSVSVLGLSVVRGDLHVSIGVRVEEATSGLPCRVLVGVDEARYWHTEGITLGPTVHAVNLPPLVIPLQLLLDDDDDGGGGGGGGGDNDSDAAAAAGAAAAGAGAADAEQRKSLQAVLVCFAEGSGEVVAASPVAGFSVSAVQTRPFFDVDFPPRRLLASTSVVLRGQDLPLWLHEEDDPAHLVRSFVAQHGLGEPERKWIANHLGEATAQRRRSKMGLWRSVRSLSLDNAPLNIILGATAAGMEQRRFPREYEGWLPSGAFNLDVRDAREFAWLFPEGGADAFLAEHVWEHLTISEGLQAAANCFWALKGGGRLRIAVPDWWNATINGTARALGKDAEEGHRVQYNLRLLTRVLRAVGFDTVTPIHHVDEAGVFRERPWRAEEGMVMRTPNYTWQFPGSTGSVSLLVDAVKPVGWRLQGQARAGAGARAGARAEARAQPGTGTLGGSTDYSFLPRMVPRADGSRGGWTLTEDASQVLPPALAALLDKALELHRAGLAREAAMLYDEVIAAHPVDHAASLGLRAAVEIGLARTAPVDAPVEESVGGAAGEGWCGGVKGGRDGGGEQRPSPSAEASNESNERAARLALAEELLTRAIMRDPFGATLHNNLGEVLRLQGRLREASIHYLEASKWAPLIAPPVYNLGLAVLASGNVEGAEAHFVEVRLMVGGG